MQNDVCEIKLRAERRAGEILSEMDMHPGNRYGPSMMEAPQIPRLADLGITVQDSHRWQTIAGLAEKTFDDHIAETKRRRDASWNAPPPAAHQTR